MIRADLIEFRDAVSMAKGALTSRGNARAIRAGNSTYGRTAEECLRNARRLERQVRIIADRALREAAETSEA